MATSVTVFTAERSQAIENGTIVSGAINGSGHLILTRHDGTTVDAGNALVAVPDQSIVHILDAASYNSATPPISYPDGVSMMYISASEATSDWTTFAGKLGSIVTVNYPSGISNDADTTQTWTRLHGTGTTPEQWIRSGNAANGWSLWKRFVISDELQGVLYEQKLTPSSFTQSTVLTAYPFGLSWLYLSDSDCVAGGWSFGSRYGIVTTYRYSNDFIMQTWVEHQAGSSGVTVLWQRTANAPSGWTPWSKMATASDPSTMGLTGEVKMWAGNTVPNGWLLCDGSLISRTTYSALFSAIGTLYGIGDGSTTFKLPPMNGKVAVGYDASDTDFNAVGKTGGEKTHVLATAEMPAHTHNNRAPNWSVTPTTGGDKAGFNTSTPDQEPTQSTGGGGAHNNMQPFVVFKYIIKT